MSVHREGLYKEGTPIVHGTFRQKRGRQVRWQYIGERWGGQGCTVCVCCSCYQLLGTATSTVGVVNARSLVNTREIVM